MGTLISQTLTVSGSKEEFGRFRDISFKKDKAGQPIDIDFERAAPVPAGLLDDARQEWQFENWGESQLMDFSVASLNDSSIAVRFHTKGMHIGPFVRVIGDKFPALTFRLAALDDGDEFPYLATCIEGAFAEKYVEATKQFVAEVEGRPREAEDEYTKPSVLEPWPTTHIRFWLTERKLTRLLQGYPVYRAPFVGLPSTLSAAQVEANFEWFMRSRVSRMGQLRGFLEKFRVFPDGSEARLRKLDRWQ